MGPARICSRSAFVCIAFLRKIAGVSGEVDAGFLLIRGLLTAGDALCMGAIRFVL